MAIAAKPWLACQIFISDSWIYNCGEKDKNVGFVSWVENQGFL